MTTNDKPPNHSAALRGRAEEMVGKDGHALAQGGADTTLEETRQLLYELQVHQIELEMQNDELRRAQAEYRHFQLYFQPQLDGQKRIVTTEAQHRYLQRKGCRMFQGFLFSEPLSLDKFYALAESRQAGMPWPGFAFFIEQLSAVFSAEEQCMRAHDYRKFQEHAAEHHQFLQKLATMQSGTEKESTVFHAFPLFP